MKTEMKAAFAAIAMAACFGTTALAQDNPLLAPAETNPLLAEPEMSSFEQQARAIDAAATKEASHPTCQNIRTNYDQQMAKILRKSGQSDGASLSQIANATRNTSGTAYRINRINRNVTGDYDNGLSRSLGKASGAVNRGASVVSDAAAIGGMFGIKGKSKEEKAAEKAAKLDAQAMDAVSQTGCPMATFG